MATVTVSPANPSVQTGASVQLSATLRDASNNILTGRVVTWSSSNTAIATVNASGLVTGVAAGTATITATSEGRTGTATVTVTAPPPPPPPAPVATVTVSPANPSVQAGGSVQLTATLRDASNNILTGRVVTWSSSNNSIATVNASGLVTAVATGSATITATSETRTGTSNVTVTAPPPPPPPGGVLFRSDWNTATGNSVNAVTDGGRYDGGVCGHQDVLSVVPGAAHGWTLTPNVLQVTNRGETRCWKVETERSVPQGINYYIRFYAMIDNEYQTNFHSVAISAATTQAALWSIEQANTAGYLHAFRYPRDPDYMDFSWTCDTRLTRRAWYRFEFFVEILSSTFRVWPRIYDAAGNLVCQASTYHHVDGGSRTLQDMNNSGGSPFTNLDLLRRFGIGYEGTGGATNTGTHWYYA
ncbi:MAG: Ig-like domain-containing protein, partial [Longimicrobiales bacterium]